MISTNYGDGMIGFVGFVGFVGFGKIGQAVAAQIVDSGCSLIVADINQILVETFQSGNFSCDEPGVGESLLRARKEGRITVSNDFSSLAQCAAVIVCIPLLVSTEQGEAPKIQFEPFDACFAALAPHVHDKMVIALETTIPVGTCRQRIRNVFSSAGKKHGRDYLLVHSPERIKSGSMRAQLMRNPKVIGGIDAEATVAGVALYKQFIPEGLIRAVDSIETAELIKLAGMVYRDVNIALANQLALYCDAMSIDVGKIIQLANTDEESSLLSPGIGVGGHCTPVYPYFLIENFKNAGLSFDLAAEGRRINNAVPEHVVEAMCQDVEVKSALILGLGFRPNIKEDICSPAYALRDALVKRGIACAIHDPLYSAKELADKGFSQSVANPYDDDFDAVILNTAHSAFTDIDFNRLAEGGCRIFVDGRNVFDPDKIAASGIAYRGIGRSGMTFLSPAAAKKAALA